MKVAILSISYVVVFAWCGSSLENIGVTSPAFFAGYGAICAIVYGAIYAIFER